MCMHLLWFAGCQTRALTCGVCHHTLALAADLPILQTSTASTCSLHVSPCKELFSDSLVVSVQTLLPLLSKTSSPSDVLCHISKS